MGNLGGIQTRSFSAYFPGLAVTCLVAVASIWLSERYGISSILAGMIIGLGLTFVSFSPRTKAGLNLCSTALLKWGIVLMGTQVTFIQITQLGAVSVYGLIGIMIVVMLTATIAARCSGQGIFFGVLVGGATAICGTSAALAIYAVLGKDRLDPNRFTFILIGITLASAISLSIYPLIASSLSFSDRQAGFLMGAAIHDLAQSLGAGYGYSREAGETATIVKLTRVALLGPIVAIIALIIGNTERNEKGKQGLKNPTLLPWYIIAFFTIMGLNSAFSAPSHLTEIGFVLSKTLLLLAVIATAISSRVGQIISQGWRPLLPITLASLASFSCSVMFAKNFL